ILQWALLTSTVGIVFRMIQERAGWVGRIVVGLFGIGWSLATFMIVPVMVLEDLNVTESIRRSAHLLKKTWGEQVVVGLHFMWMYLALGLVGIVIGVLAWPLAIVYFAIVAAVMSAAREIFVVALYRYAVDGEPPAGYSRDALGGYFRPRSI